jgi:hypothetical protein
LPLASNSTENELAERSPIEMVATPFTIRVIVIWVFALEVNGQRIDSLLPGRIHKTIFRIMKVEKKIFEVIFH